MSLKLNKKFSRYIIEELFNNIVGNDPIYDLVLFLSHNNLRGSSDETNFTTEGKESIQGNNVDIQAVGIINTSNIDTEVMAGVSALNGETVFLNQKYIMKTPYQIADNDGFLYEYLYVIKEITSEYIGVGENETVNYNVVTLALVKHGEITGSYDRFGASQNTEPDLSSIDDIIIIAQSRPTTRILAKTGGDGSGLPSQEEKEFKMLIKI